MLLSPHLSTPCSQVGRPSGSPSQQLCRVRAPLFQLRPPPGALSVPSWGPALKTSPRAVPPGAACRDVGLVPCRVAVGTVCARVLQGSLQPWFKTVPPSS